MWLTHPLGKISVWVPDIKDAAPVPQAEVKEPKKKKKK